MFSLLFIEAIILILAFNARSIPTERKGVVIGIAVGIAVVYILTLIVEYIFELTQSKKLNEDLINYQNRNASITGAKTE